MKSNKNIKKYVAIAMVTKEGCVLVQHRDNIPNIASPDMFAICGGKQEKIDPTLKHAAARELLEETGYKVKLKDLQILQHDEFDTPTGYVTRDFYWCIYDEVQPIQCLEGQSIKFYDINEISDLEFCDPYHRKYLKEASNKVTLYDRGSRR